MICWQTFWIKCLLRSRAIATGSHVGGLQLLIALFKGVKYFTQLKNAIDNDFQRKFPFSSHSPYFRLSSIKTRRLLCNLSSQWHSLPAEYRVSDSNDSRFAELY
jgi:hypothetical protein